MLEILFALKRDKKNSSDKLQLVVYNQFNTIMFLADVKWCIMIYASKFDIKRKVPVEHA
jgi:hypothetical protein